MELSSDPDSPSEEDEPEVDPVSSGVVVEGCVVEGCVVPLGPPDVPGPEVVTAAVVDPVSAPSVAPSEPESLSHPVRKSAQTSHEADLERCIGGE